MDLGIPGHLVYILQVSDRARDAKVYPPAGVIKSTC